VLERDACDVQARVYIYVCVCVCLCVYLCVCLYGGMVLPDPTAKGECKALLKEYRGKALSKRGSRDSDRPHVDRAFPLYLIKRTTHSINAALFSIKRSYVADGSL